MGGDPGKAEMKIGILSDAHGNALGLKTCLRFLEAQRIEKLYFLGDAVGYLPDVNGVLAELEGKKAVCILGNHEGMLLGKLPIDSERDKIYRLAETRKKLEPAHGRIIEEWKDRLAVELDGRRLLFVHGSPWDPLCGYVYPDTPIDAFADLPHDAVFMGHSHRPFIRKAGNVLVVNVGSCGLPRDVGALAGVCVYETDTGEASIFRIPIDIDSILRLYGQRLHEVVMNTFKRTSADFVGSVVRDE